MKKRDGNVGQLMTMGLCILALTVIVTAYFNCMGLVQQKTQVGQLARKYILKMETVGYLSGNDQAKLLEELNEIGVSEVSLEHSTMSPGEYGQTIELDIRGKLKGEYSFQEYRVSTAKY